MNKIYAIILSSFMVCSATSFVGCSGLTSEDADSLLATAEVEAMSNAIQYVNEYNGSYTIRSLSDGEETIWMYNANTGVSFYGMKGNGEEYYVYTTPTENGRYRQYVNMPVGSSIVANVSEDKTIIEFENREDLIENGYRVGAFGLNIIYYSESVNDVIDTCFLIDLDKAPKEITEESMKAFWLEGIKNNADAMTGVLGVEFEYVCKNTTITTENDRINFAFDVDFAATKTGSFMGMTISECDINATLNIFIQNAKIVQIKQELDMQMVAGNLTSAPKTVGTMDFTYSYDESLAPTIEDLQALEDSVTKTE